LEAGGAHNAMIQSAIYQTLYTKKELEKQTHEFDEQQEAILSLLQRSHDNIDTFVAESFSEAITRMRYILDKYMAGQFKHRLESNHQIILVD
jgi:hypothetical protein